MNDVLIITSSGMNYYTIVFFIFISIVTIITSNNLRLTEDISLQSPCSKVVSGQKHTWFTTWSPRDFRWTYCLTCQYSDYEYIITCNTSWNKCNCLSSPDRNLLQARNWISGYTSNGSIFLRKGNKADLISTLTEAINWV